jgi:NADH dehydrogenase
VEVWPDCSVPGHPELFVVGDLMSLNGLPGLAEVAMQSGRHAARTIVQQTRGRRPRAFRYLDLGTVATIARFRAVANIGRLQLAGPLAWLLWLAVHLTFLTGFRNRVAASANWAFAFLGHRRRQRTFTQQQVLARIHGLDAAHGTVLDPSIPGAGDLPVNGHHPENAGRTR